MHALIQFWFHLLQDWHYIAVFLLMALESSIVPVPSEIVMPPAAYWATQGTMNLWLVVLAGTAGSWFGSAVSYWVSLWICPPLLVRFGKYVLIPERKLTLAESWAADNGLKGVFFARLLPVVRHLISIPAGILRMRFLPFSVVTTAGAGIWCLVLSLWGAHVLGDRPDIADNPDAIYELVKARMWWFIGAVVVLGVLFVVATRKKKAPAPAS